MLEGGSGAWVRVSASALDQPEEAFLLAARSFPHL